MGHLNTELHIGESYARSHNAVAQNAPERIGAAETFVDDTLHVELVEVGVDIERTLPSQIELCANTVGKSEATGDKGNVVSP